MALSDVVRGLERKKVPDQLSALDRAKRNSPRSAPWDVGNGSQQRETRSYVINGFGKGTTSVVSSTATKDAGFSP